MQVRNETSRVSLVSGHVIAASCHYFTIRPKALGQVDKKERRPVSEAGRNREESLIGREELREEEGNLKVAL